MIYCTNESVFILKKYCDRGHCCPTGAGGGGWSGSSTAVDVRKTGPNVGFPAAVSVTATSTTGRTATWSGTVDLVEPPG